MSTEKERTAIHNTVGHEMSAISYAVAEVSPGNFAAYAVQYGRPSFETPVSYSRSKERAIVYALTDLCQMLEVRR